MKYRDSQGNFKELRIKAQDNIPVGTIVDYEGDTVPDGYIEVEDEGEIYSTEEIRIGTWIDGKPIYRKVIDFGDLPNVDTKVVAHNILNIKQIINIQAIASLKTSPYSTMILNNSDPDGLQYSVHIAIDTRDILISTGSNRSALTAFVILEYTKTTD